MTRSYCDLVELKTFEERFDYLKLSGEVGATTFGYERYLNQTLYTSSEWRSIRDEVIVRDLGCDLGIEGYEIHGRILIHHIDPITVNDIVTRHPKVFDLNNLICVTHRTHNAIHYGDKSLLPLGLVERTKNDTCPWLR